MKELIELRESFGNDKRAINRHNVRYFEHEGVFYCLDRVTDAYPPYFTLERYNHDPRKSLEEEGFGSGSKRLVIPTRIKVKGEEHWHTDSTSGKKSWAEAVALVTPLIVHDREGRVDAVVYRYGGERMTGTDERMYIFKTNEAASAFEAWAQTHNYATAISANPWRVVVEIRKPDLYDGRRIEFVHGGIEMAGEIVGNVQLRKVEDGSVTKFIREYNVRTCAGLVPLTIREDAINPNC